MCKLIPKYGMHRNWELDSLVNGFYFILYTNILFFYKFVLVS